MYTLYHRYLDIVKQEEVQKYNQKHREYIARVSKKAPLQDNFTTTLRDNKIPVDKPKRQRFINKERTQTRDHKPQDYPERTSRQNFGVEQIPIPQKQEYNDRQIPALVKDNNRPAQLPVQDQVVELFECPEGCGRKFASKQLEKHAKNCKKIFQEKRKPFEVKRTDSEAQMIKNKAQPTDQKPNGKVKPSWKKSSQQLRNMLKRNPAKDQEEIDDRILCPGCNRKFNDKAAQKHIPNCVKRNHKK